jgi:hypothetical protein
MRSLLLGLIVVAQVSYQCSSNPSDPFGSKVLELKPGEPQTANGVAITFDSVISDSRCPLTVVCIQLGDARVKFLFRTKSSHTQAVELTLIESSTNSFRADNGAVVKFNALSPYPEAGHTFNPLAFRAVVQVSKAR